VWSTYLLFFLFTLDHLRSARNFRFISATFLCISGMIGILCLLDYATLPDFRSLEGTLRMRYAKYAELLITALPIVWMAGAYSRTRKTYFLVTLVAAAGWLAAMLSLSKGAFIAGVIGMTIMFAGGSLLSSRAFRPRLALSIGIWIALTVSVQLASPYLFTLPSTTDYLSGKAGAIRESSLSRVFVWNVGQRMAVDNWLKGVGADNFGVRFNASRSAYRLSDPTEPNEEFVSDGLVERAHNELLQVFAELGVIGVALLVLAAAIFGSWLIKTLAARRYKLSPMLWAAIGGMAAFAASSMVSSFSLRLVQNGLVFFLVLAVAVREMSKGQRQRSLESSVDVVPAGSYRVMAAVSLLLLLSIATFALKAGAEYFVLTADGSPDTATAIERYELARTLDPDYAGAYLRSSGRSYVAGDITRAAGDLRTAIDRGLGVVLTYSALATCYTRTGDLEAAERTFDEALRIFPRSVFLRVRYSVFLDERGRTEAAKDQLAIAREINASQATGWHNIITTGSVAAYFAAKTDPNIAAPADLLPEAAVFEYLDKSPGEAP
jgi:pentatricopeptide repeat protein